MRAILNKIKEIRTKKGLSQENMGDLLKIAQVTYGQIENGKRRLTVEMLVQIALALETDPTELMVIKPAIMKHYTVEDLPPKTVEEEEQTYAYRTSFREAALQREIDLLRKAVADKEEIISLLKSKH